MPDPNVNQVVATVWEYIFSDGAVDQIFTSQALLSLFRDGGYAESADGGRLFEATLEYQANNTFRSISETETIDTTRVDVFDAARYDQKIVAGSIVFSDLEELRNAAANRKLDVVKAKLKNGISSSLQIINQMLWGDGTGNSGKDPDGLRKVIPADPTTGTVGGVNAALWAFWRPKQALGTKTTTTGDNLRAAMYSVHNQCSLGGVEKKPTGIVTDRPSHEIYVKLLTDLERLVKDSGGNSEADLGFPADAVEFLGIPLIYDEDASPAGSMYFVNKNYLKLISLKGAFNKLKQPVEPANALMRVHRVFSVLNLCASARRHQGVVTLIT